jgi:hypothetical protein
MGNQPEMGNQAEMGKLTLQRWEINQSGFHIQKFADFPKHQNMLIAEIRATNTSG